MKVNAPRAGSQLLGLGAYRPLRVVTNAEICERIDSTDQWIRERSGIAARRMAAPNESVVDMALEASGKALASAGLTAQDIDNVLVATVTHPYQTPSAAAELADRLEMTNPAALDIGAACAGFCYGIGLADSLIRAGSSEHVLVVGVEKLTDFIDMSDRGTAFIFGDGAGAAVVGPSDVPKIGPVVWGSDGGQRDTITMTQSWIEYRDAPGPVYPALSMQGQSVFRWAVREVVSVTRAALAAAGVTIADIDAFVPHQANMRITDALVRSLDLPDRVVIARDIENTGNTSAASVPLALEQLVSSGAVSSGDTALLVGFGAGLAWAAQVVIVP